MLVLWIASLHRRRNIDLETIFLSVKKCYRRLIQRKLVFEKFFLETNGAQYPKSCPEYHQPIHFQTFAPSSVDITQITAFFQIPHDKLILQVFSKRFSEDPCTITVPEVFFLSSSKYLKNYFRKEINILIEFCLNDFLSLSLNTIH